MFPSELVVAKTKLESEGIECRVLDELSVQSYNFLSNAIGGVKLQVPESEFQRAHSILIQGGFINEDQSSKPNFLERKLSDPKIYRLIKSTSIVISILIVLSIIGSFINLYLNKPTDFERLIGEYWCVDHVIYQNEVFYPNTLSDKAQLYLSGQCRESIIFDSTGIVQFPGFNSATFNHNWILGNNQITFSKIDTLESVFYGTYDYEMSKNELIMISDSIKIVCVKPQRWMIN